MTDEQLIKRISEMSVSIFGGIDGINLAKLTKNFKEEFVRRIIVKSPSASGQKSLIKTIREKYIEWKRETDITYKMFPSPFGGREYLYPKYMEDLYFRIDCGEIIEAEEFTMISSWDDAPSAHSSEATAQLESRTAQLESRIAELEKENETLKEQVELYKNKEKGTALGLNQGQAALFGLSLANTFGFNYSNKKTELAPMLHNLFGWGESKLAKCVCEGCEKEERDELANLFKELCPPLYDTIMNWGELPQ